MPPLGRTVEVLGRRPLGMDPSDLRALATDAVVLTEDGVVLLERSHPPHEGEWVFPGGMVEQGERTRTACAREAPEDPPAMGFDHGDILADAVSPR